MTKLYNGNWFYTIQDGNEILCVSRDIENARMLLPELEKEYDTELKIHLNFKRTLFYEKGNSKSISKKLKELLDHYTKWEM